MVSVQLQKHFTGLLFCGEWTKKFSHFTGHFFWQRLWKNCFVEFSCCYHMSKIFAKIFDSLKIQNVGNFDFEKRAAKITQIFHFLEHSYFLMGDPIDMNVSVFWEIPVCFLKSVVLQLFLKYTQSYDILNLKRRPKFNNSYKIGKLFSIYRVAHKNVPIFLLQ